MMGSVKKSESVLSPSSLEREKWRNGVAVLAPFGIRRGNPAGRVGPHEPVEGCMRNEARLGLHVGPIMSGSVQGSASVLGSRLVRKKK